MQRKTSIAYMLVFVCLTAMDAKANFGTIVFDGDNGESNLDAAIARVPRSLKDTSSIKTCGEGKECATNEVCMATVRGDGSLSSEECRKDAKLVTACSRLGCQLGTTCRAHISQAEDSRQIHVGCVYRSEELDRFAAEHNATLSAATTQEANLVPTESDTPVAWCTVITVLSLLPLIVLAAIVIYRFVYKLPRIGREKEELTRLFQTLGYDENTEIYKKVMDWMYGPSR